MIGGAWLPGRIALRYSRPAGGYLSFVTLVAALGLALGCAVLIVVLSVMNGFERELRTRVLGVLPQAVISRGGGIEDWQSLARQAEAHPRVTAAAPLVHGAVMLAARSQATGAELTGILPARERRVSILPRFLADEAFDRLEPGRFGVLVGARLADTLDLASGDRVTVVMPEAHFTPAGVFPRQKRMEVVGIYRTDSELDARQVYVHLDDARRLFRRGDTVDGIRLSVTELFQAGTIAREVARDADVTGLRVSDWTRTHGNLYQAIGMQKAIMFVLLSLVIGVAAFNVVSMLTMAVTSKQADIAILRTMGFARGDVVAVFVVEGALIAVLGILVGLGLGSGAALALPNAAGALQTALGASLMQEYFIGYLPSQLRVGDLLAVAGVALVLAVVTTVAPARRAARVAPAEVLRYE